MIRVGLHVLRSRWSSDWKSINCFSIDLWGRIDAIWDRTGETGMFGHPLVNTRELYEILNLC